MARGYVKALSTFTALGSGPVGLAWDGRFLWNADYAAGRLFRIDPATGHSDASLVCPGNLSGLAWDGRSLWQSLHDGGALRAINPATNDFDRTIMVHDHGWLCGVAWDGAHLYAASQRHGKLFVIDPQADAVVRTLPAPAVPGDIAYRDGALWLGIAYPMVFNETFNHFEWAGETQQYALVQLDATTGAELARYELDFLPMGLTWAGDDLWLAHTAEKRLVRAAVVTGS